MKTLSIVVLLALLSGCMTYNEARVGEFGDSVYAIQRQQIHDPATAASPGVAVSPDGIDGTQVESVLKAYRSFKGNAADVSQPIEIQVQD